MLPSKVLTREGIRPEVSDSNSKIIGQVPYLDMIVTSTLHQWKPRRLSNSEKLRMLSNPTNYPLSDRLRLAFVYHARGNFCVVDHDQMNKQ